MSKPIRVAYLLSNPIQYQAPLLKKLSEFPDISLEVLFQSQRSLKPHTMPGFNVVASWDVSLVEGYRHYFLPCIGSDEHFSFFRPWNYGLLKKFRQEKYQVLWVHGYSSFFNLYAILLAKMFGMKVLVRGESHLLALQRGYWREKLRRPFFYLLNKLVDGFLTVGSLNRQFYEYYHIPAHKLFFAPYTVDNDFFQRKFIAATHKVSALKAELTLDANKPVILYASSLLTRKHPGDLLAAYVQLSPDGKQAPDAYLIFVGDGVERSLLEQKSRELGWDTIKFLGFKNQTELPAYYAMSDIFVLPSEKETWGLVVNEAMNAGKAIIVSDQVGSGYDLVKSGENGFVFRARDVEALSQFLRQLIHDRAMVMRMGTQSAQRIQQWGIHETAQGIRSACLTVTGDSH